MGRPVAHDEPSSSLERGLSTSRTQNLRLALNSCHGHISYPVKMQGDGNEEEDIGFVSTFKYLGFNFENGGDFGRRVEIRMAMASSAFGKLRHIWQDSKLSRRLKLRIYSTYVVAVLTWGLPAWRLGECSVLCPPGGPGLAR
eukprot:SAG11_NODE_500_length_8926_cov_3.943129_2_plen_142_part_00